MRNIPAYFRAELESRAFIQALLIYMELPDADIRITNWSIAILHDSNLYYPRAFELYPVSYGTTRIVDDVTVIMDDTDKGLFGSFGDYDAGNYPFTLTWVVLDNSLRELSSVDIFKGTIDQWEYEPGKLVVTVASLFNQWARETTSRYSGSCRWRVFKGTECKYDGEVLECDRRYATCKSLIPIGGDEDKGNTDNFGGFRWLPSMVNKRIDNK